MAIADIFNVDMGGRVAWISSLIVYATVMFIMTIVLLCGLTWVGTTIRYHIAIWKFRQMSSKNNNPGGVGKDENDFEPLAPPTLPYAIPWLGSALTFLNDNPGVFFRWLQNKLATTYISARSGGDAESGRLQAITLLLGGNRTHLINSPSMVQGLFKIRYIDRVRFNREIMIKALGLEKADDDLLFGGKGPKDVDIEATQHENNAKYLLSTSAVNCLTSKFLEFFLEEIKAETFSDRQTTGGWKSVDVVLWLREKMLIASTKALMGPKILEMSPDFCKQYWDFDTTLMHRFYGLPRWLYPRAYEALEEMLENFMDFHRYTLGMYPDGPPEEPDWEPVMGAKFIRKRHDMYRKVGISVRAIAVFNLGLQFGLASNAIPATSWMLLHLLSPTNSDLLAKVQAELQTAVTEDGSLDVPTLVSLTYLNASFLETLRLYVDALITREVKADVILDKYLLKQGDIVMAPSYLGHRDAALWARDDMPPEDVWCPERFIKYDEETGEPTVSTTGTAGKFFPFGGGNQICPGRIFAKQEILGAVAAFLTSFEVEFDTFVDEGRNSRAANFPKVKKTLNGSGVVAMDGDLRVKLRRK